MFTLFVRQDTRRPDVIRQRQIVDRSAKRKLHSGLKILAIGAPNTKRGDCARLDAEYGVVGGQGRLDRRTTRAEQLRRDGDRQLPVVGGTLEQPPRTVAQNAVLRLRGTSVCVGGVDIEHIPNAGPLPSVQPKAAGPQDSIGRGPDQSNEIAVRAADYREPVALPGDGDYGELHTNIIESRII